MSMFLSKPSISFHWDLKFNSKKFFEYDIIMLVCIVGHKIILGRCQLSYLALDYFLPHEIHHFNFFLKCYEEIFVFKMKSADVRDFDRM